MLEQSANFVLRIQSPQFTIIVNLQIRSIASLHHHVFTFPSKPANNATSATGQGPEFKDQARDSVARGGATAPSVPNKASSPSSPGGGPAFKDQMRHADPPRPPASDRPPTVPLAEAVPVNDSVVEREQRQMEWTWVNGFGGWHEWNFSSSSNKNKQHSSSTGITKKQWLIAGLVIFVVIVATSVAITAFATGSSPSPSPPTSNTDPATGSGVVTTLRPAMPTTTNVPMVSPTSLAPVLSPIDAPITAPMEAPILSPTGAPVVSPTRRPVVSPTRQPVVSPTGRPVVSPTSSPVAAPTPSSTDRAVAIRDYINSITLSSGPLSYPSQASPQERALQWLIEDDLTTDVSDTLAQRQRFALATMWFANGPFDSDHTDTWLSSTDECEWASVETCVNGEVTRLSLVDDGLNGSIPADVGLLTALTIGFANFRAPSPRSNDGFSGSIPTQIGLLTALT